ncbi:MAG: hypothetical protein ACSLFP_16795 [Acidimicrobiales bacterium]
MRLLDLLAQFDEALDWPLDDDLLADHRPSTTEADDGPWPSAEASVA